MKPGHTQLHNKSQTQLLRFKNLIKIVVHLYNPRIMMITQTGAKTN
jgi:hypothetical protein